MLPVKAIQVNPRRQPTVKARHLGLNSRPLATDPLRLEEATRQLYALASGLEDGEQIVLQLLVGSRLLPPVYPRGSSFSWLMELAGALVAAPSPSPAPATKDLGDLHGARAHLRIGVATPGNPARQSSLLASVLGALRTLEAAETRLSLRPSQAKHLNKTQLPWGWSLRLRSLDLAALTGWPVGEPPLPLLGGMHPRLLPPPAQLVSAPRQIGITSGPGEKSYVSLPWIDSLFHTHILGPTGSGKSTVLLNLVLADIRKGMGTLVIDPKGDLVADLLARIPKDRQPDVVVINPEADNPVGFSPLAASEKDAHVVADSLLSTFRSLFKENWGIRTEDALSAAFLTLARHPEANLLWLTPLLIDPVFRRKVLREVPPDPHGADQYWQRFEALCEAKQAVEIAPVLNKFRQITMRPGLRAILGQTSPRFSFDQMLSGNKIVLLALNKGRIGSESARLLGSLVIAHLWTKILARQALPPSRRSIRTVYIDEVHDFLTGIPGDLADALAQARSLGVGFILANQYRGQLSPEMREAIDANTRSKIVFGLSGSDAKDMAKLSQKLEAKDFLLLPKYQAYVNLMQDSQNTGWFSIQTCPPPREISSPGDVYFVSHQRYGVPAEETEKALSRLLTPTLTEAASGTSYGRKAKADPEKAKTAKAESSERDDKASAQARRDKAAKVSPGGQTSEGAPSPGAETAQPDSSKDSESASRGSVLGGRLPRKPRPEDDHA